MEEKLERDSELTVGGGVVEGPLRPPRVNDSLSVGNNPNLPGVPISYGDGAGIAWELDQEKSAQMTHKQVWSDKLNQSLAGSLVERFKVLPDTVNELFKSGVADLEPHRAELTAGVPLHLHDNIMSSLTLSSARARADRLREDQVVQARLAKQTGISRNAVMLAAGLLDVDLPLMFASGGTVAAGKTALTVARTTRALTGSTALSKVAGDFAVGVTGGALAGTIAGSAGMIARDDYDMHTMFQMILADAATGGVLNSAVGKVLPDYDVWERAANLEMEANISAMYRDLHAAKSNPMHPLNSVDAPVDDIPRDSPFVRDGYAEGTVNAASLGTSRVEFDITAELENVQKARAWTPKSETERPVLDTLTEKMLEQGAADREIEIALAAREHLLDIDYAGLKAEDMSNPLVRVLVGGSDFKVNVSGKEIPVGKVLGDFFTVGVREFTTLAHSKTNTGQWIASEILSSASGLGRNGTTAAGLKDMYFYSARTRVADAFSRRRSEFYAGRRNFMQRWVMNDSEFSAESRLALDAHRQGKQVPPEWKEFVSAVDEMNNDLMRRMKENDVLGVNTVKANPGYFKYDILPEKVLKAVRESSEQGVIDAFAKAYRKRNQKLTSKLSTRLAKAVVRRRLNQARGIDAADSTRLTRSVGSSVEQILIDEGVKKSDRAAIMKLLGEQDEGRAVASFLRDRVEMDLEIVIPGTNTRIVDLFSDDIEGSMLRYAHEAAGAAALSNKGIRSSKDVDDLVNALAREAAAVGEDIDPARIHGLLSRFTGGVHVGVDPLSGKTTHRVSAAVSALGSATRSSLLQRLGLTTLMDAANTVATNGLARSGAAAIDRIGLLNKGAKRATEIQSGLESIRFLTGQDHMVYRSHLAVEELNADKVNFGMSVLSGLRNIENATYYLSGHHHVLSFLQKTSADATFVHLIAGISGKSDGMSKRAMRDMGISESTRSELRGLIEAGDIDLTSGNKKVELTGLSNEAQDELSLGMLNAVNQQMQRGLIGESSMWMDSDIGKILSSLKTFGILATQKQLARRLMVGGKPDVLFAAAWQIGFAYAVLSVSQAINGTEMSTLDRSRLAVTYSPVLGIGPNTVDPIMNMLGFDDLHFSPYGRYSSPLSSPMLETAEKLPKSLGSIRDILAGDGDYNDMQNARAMFFLHWYGMKRLWDAM